jgi:hypothetical protein
MQVRGDNVHELTAARLEAFSPAVLISTPRCPSSACNIYLMKQNTLLAFIILASTLIGFFSLTAGHEWGDDFASYIMQAGSIVDGSTREFVVRNSFTIHESSFQIGPVAYPWGYPLILAPVYALRGNSPLALKLLNLFFFGGFLACLSALWRRTDFTQAENLLLVALFAFNPELVGFLDQILSDVPFLFFAILTLFLVKAAPVRNLAWYAAVGIVIAIAASIRSTGIVLLISLLIVQVYELWRSRDKDTVVRAIVLNMFVVCCAFGLMRLLYAISFPGGEESYFEHYQAFQLQTVIEFIPKYFLLFQEFFGETPVWKYLYSVLFIFFLIGIWVRRKQEMFFIVLFLLWMVLLVTWPPWQGLRFIFPLLPIFIYFTFRGMKFVLLDLLPAKYQRLGSAVLYSFWLFIVVLFLFNSASQAYVNLQNDRSIAGAYDAHSMEMYDYIKKDTAPDSVLVFFKPRALRLMTGRDAIMSAECERMLVGDYIVLSRRTRIAENHQIPPEEIAACNLPLREVFKNSRFVIFEIEK